MTGQATTGQASTGQPAPGAAATSDRGEPAPADRDEPALADRDEAAPADRDERGDGAGEVRIVGGQSVRLDRRLGEIVRRRPAGITAHQWGSASRTPVACVVGDPDGPEPTLVIELQPTGRGADAARADRATDAVCTAAGVGVIRVESSGLALPAHARRVADYILAARAFHLNGRADKGPGVRDWAALDESGADRPLGYRDIQGRLPDGRTGFVNDLGAVARAAAIDAYANRQLTDPIIRGLHVHWRGGPAEGWGWLEIRPGEYVFERARIWQLGATCGVEPGRLAEDLAAAAIGERLKTLVTEAPAVRGRAELAAELDALRTRRDDLDDDFHYDHLTFD